MEELRPKGEIHLILKTFLPNLLMEASSIGKVLKVLISKCGSLKVKLVLPYSLNMTLHLDSALHPVS